MAAHTPFPFTAIVGQQAFRRALVLAAINPEIGGVLICGSKGTAKSTAVRSLAALLPPIDVVAGCPYNCSGPHDRNDCPHCGAEGSGEIIRRPVHIIELPRGTSTERLAGRVVTHPNGARTFQPGLLAAAHRGILYVDDINLLDEALVDRLLDAAATAVNLVEHDGTSVAHRTSFIPVGTMNLEEGSLRPRLLDRFGLLARTDDHPTADQRAEILRRRVAFEANPIRFAGRWRDEEAQLQRDLASARDLVAKVEVPEPMLEAIAHIAAEERADGARADLATYHTARAIAALEGRTEVNLADVREAALFALPHRQRRTEQPDFAFDPSHVDEVLATFGSATR